MYVYPPTCKVWVVEVEPTVPQPYVRPPLKPRLGAQVVGDAARAGAAFATAIAGIAQAVPWTIRRRVGECAKVLPSF